MKALLLLAAFFVIHGRAQAQEAAPAQAVAPVSAAKLRPKGPITRILFSADYNSWFEKLVISPLGGTKQQSQAQFFGYGLNIEKNWYSPAWGWGVGAGALYGGAIGGDKSGSAAYFQTGVPWWAVRVSPRAFWRLNPQTDLGLNVSAFYKHTSWPDGASGTVIQSGSDLMAGLFVEARLRLNPRIELIQAIGFLYKDESTYWRLGLGYHL